MADTPFELFGKYLLLNRLAAGGMAEIFLARPATPDANGRILVIKRILGHIANDETFVKMFKAETQICMGFDHPNTVQLHDFGQVGNQFYIAMEYIEGKNLRQISNKCAENGYKMPVSLTVSLIAQAAAGLHYAHTYENRVTREKMNIIHRDVTPHNMIVSYNGNLKIIDFGIAKAAVEADRTQTGTIKGKIGYLSPEQTEGLPLDARTDIFALGIVLWELLTGHRLFAAPGENEVTILSRIKECQKHIAPPSTKNSSIPDELNSIVMKALAKDPNDRYQNAAEMQKALRDFLLSYNSIYSYSDVGETIRKLFQSEIEVERRDIQVVNEMAQKFLTLLPAPPKGAPAPDQTVIHDPTGTVWLRVLEKVKKENRQATMRHYVLLVLYVITVIGLKLDQEKMFLGRWFATSEPVQLALTSPPSGVGAKGAVKKQQKNNR